MLYLPFLTIQLMLFSFLYTWPFQKIKKSKLLIFVLQLEQMNKISYMEYVVDKCQ